jgi:CRP-like cAMP-binding protein
VTAPEIRDLVAGHPFSAGLSPAEVDAIAAGAHVVDLAAGQHLFREGRPADHAFLVTHGHIGIELHLPHRGAVAVSTVGPGELLGWSWLVAPHVWRFDATARSAARVVALEAGTLRAACDQDPVLDHRITRQVIATMTARLEAARHQLLDLYGHDHR